MGPRRLGRLVAAGRRGGGGATPLGRYRTGLTRPKASAWSTRALVLLVLLGLLLLLAAATLSTVHTDEPLDEPWYAAPLLSRTRILCELHRGNTGE